MVNLIDNALKYTNNKHKIIISIVNHKENVTVKIWNPSEFIEQQKLDNIFEKFYRLEDTNDSIGSGIGLYICKTIVNLHNGKIRAIYENDGISINISLPKLKKVLVK